MAFNINNISNITHKYLIWPTRVKDGHFVPLQQLLRANIGAGEHEMRKNLLFLCVLYLFTLAVSFNPQQARLSIDYGPRMIGIARGTHFGVVQPHVTIANTGNLPQVARKILTLAKTWTVSEIVLGIPLDSDGKLHYGVRNINGRICLDFSKVLCSISNVEYPNQFKTILFDECFTTKEATLRLKQDNVKGKNMETLVHFLLQCCTDYCWFRILTNFTFPYLLASLDSMSAACILERYIEDLGEGSIEAQPCVYPPPAELANFDYNVVKKHIRKLYYPPERGK